MVMDVLFFSLLHLINNSSHELHLASHLVGTETSRVGSWGAEIKA